MRAGIDPLKARPGSEVVADYAIAHPRPSNFFAGLANRPNLRQAAQLAPPEWPEKSLRENTTSFMSGVKPIWFASPEATKFV